MASMAIKKLHLMVAAVCVLLAWVWLPARLIGAVAQVGGKKGVDIRTVIQAPGKGFLSLGVYNQAGTLVRSLSYALPVAAGAHPFTWDATTDLGLPVQPGTYHVRGVWFKHPVQAKYVMKVGVSGNPPYTLSNGLGGWGGNLGGPEAVCSNGKELVAVFGCVESPLNTGLQRMDATGKILGRYYSFFPWDARLAGALTQQHFYLADAWFGGKRLVIGKYRINANRGKILADIPTGNHVTTNGRWVGRWICDVEGLAVNGNRLYVPVLLDNHLFVVDKHTVLSRSRNVTLLAEIEMSP